MHFLDWILIVIPLLLVFFVAAYARRYVSSVAGFLSGGRLAGRYLLAVASGESSAGVVVFVAAFEAFHRGGFSVGWWSNIGTPLYLWLGLVGFVTYRYRQTMAMTLAQFFEVRYSKRFRFCTGVLGFVAGVLNFSIIPAISARFFVVIFGLPEKLSLPGFSCDTYVLLMALFISVTLVVVLSGGVVTIMLTNCAEGVISLIFYLLVIGALLMVFKWEWMSEALTSRLVDGQLVPRPAGQSLINPFDSFGVKDFNIWYVLMGMFGGVYGTMAWQYQSGYNSASKSAHEGRMAGLLGSWRGWAKGLTVTLLGLCALTLLNHPHFAAEAANVHKLAAGIGDAHSQKQMLMPIALTQLLPVGVMGALCVTFLMGMFGGDAMHMHSWGGIFVQDIIVPLRKKPFDARQHLFVLRLAITGVALFSFLFGIFFRQTEYIFMWWAVTNAIFTGGIGACIIGGLYWKKGTASGAWASLITGSTLSVGGIILRQPAMVDAVESLSGLLGRLGLDPAWLAAHVGPDRLVGGAEAGFPLNGVQIGFGAALCAVVCYILFSLLTCRENFNMDRMLHRGAYARKKTDAELQAEETAKRLPLWRKITGINDDFTRTDKWIAGSVVGWGLFWFVVFAVVTAWNLLPHVPWFRAIPWLGRVVTPWTDGMWSGYWHVTSIVLPCFISVVTVIWFAWGGTRDMIDLFKNLKNFKSNDLDNGTVVNHQNAADLAADTAEGEAGKTGQ